MHELIRSYVDDLRKICATTADESEIFERLAPRVAVLGQDRSWVEDRFMSPDPSIGFSAYLLHAESDQSLAVLAVSWVPGMGIEPHDHGTWAVVAGVIGDERNIRYKRLDDGKDPNYAQLEKKGEYVAGPGDVVCLKSGGIHEVRNESDAVALSLHTYGKHINHTVRYRFNVGDRSAERFQVAMN